MRVTSFGLFWRKSEVEWYPGQGNRGQFHLIGRIGANSGRVRLADFRKQQGIYILYDEYGSVYTGLNRNQGLGKRLKDHTDDHLAGKWDRFSWFGFHPLGPVSNGVQGINDQADDIDEGTDASIGDLEALLIKVLNPRLNKSKMKLQDAEEWTQVPLDDVEIYRERVLKA